jgi:hypothetical protein
MQAKKEQHKTTSAREQAQSLLSEYPRQMNRRLPGLSAVFSSVEDPRRRKHYGMYEILMGGMSMFLLKQGSRNSINNKRLEECFTANYTQHFAARLPHQDTVADVLSALPSDKLEQAKMTLISGLFDQKWLRKYRLLNRYYMVAIDATGVVTFDHRHCEHCLTKKYKNGKTCYFHYVLEAKPVTPDGHCLSLATEWVENPGDIFDKQDCELKAFVRLAGKLKQHYPRLPVCLLGDGLYPNRTVFDICRANEWKYVLVLQDKSLKSVREELILSRNKSPSREVYTVREGMRISSKYRFQKDIPYSRHNLHWIQCIENKKKDAPQGKKPEGEAIRTVFEYVTNIEPSTDNVNALCFAGRLRWKIENEGFNTQKCRDYELEHKYCRKSYQGMKNYYTLLQIAHLINQLIEKSKVGTALLKEHSKQTIRNLWINLLAYMLFVMPENHNPKPHPT